jgi:hypothetical protein
MMETIAGKGVPAISARAPSATSPSPSSCSSLHAMCMCGDIPCISSPETASLAYVWLPADRRNFRPPELAITYRQLAAHDHVESGQLTAVVETFRTGVVLRLWPRSRRLSIATGQAPRVSQRKCGRRRSPRGAQSHLASDVYVSCDTDRVATSSCYSQLSRILKGKGAVTLFVCCLLPVGVLGTVGTHPKRTYGPLREV